jgi:hypothetical protein
MLFIKHDSNSRQINALDSRAYTNDEVNFYPSVTHVLGVVDKGDNFHKYLKSNGFNSDYLLREAMELGHRVHAITELYDTQPDKTINVREYDADGRVVFEHDMQTWGMLSKYVEFTKRFTPNMLAVEQVLCSETLGVGGQVDRVAEINGERWLIDLKSGAFTYDDYDLQLAAYKYLWDEEFPLYPIDKMGILHLNAQTRTEGKKDAIQGKGWQLKPIDAPYEELIDIFKGVLKTWRWRNPNWRPMFLSYPDHYCKQEILNNPPNA